jgi:phosphatidylserine/phosphatidylglycerophosphate/cardiolipin synthase-like enzyme
MVLSMVMFVQPITPQPDTPAFPRTTQGQTHFLANTTTGSATVECYTSPDSSYVTTLKYLRQAQDEILITMYAISNGYLLHELYDALVRNSNMVIHVIVSWKWASGSENHWTHAALYNISQLPGYGVNVFAYKSRTDLSFTHAKYIIIDREVVLVQSANWAKSGIPPVPSEGNREWGVAIQNTDVVDYFLNVFGSDAASATPYVSDIGDYDHLSNLNYTGSYPAPFSPSTFTGSMTITSLVSPEYCIPAIVALIDSATTTLDVQQMYSKADWDGSPNQFNDAIKAAAARGVYCRVMLDNRSSGMQPVADDLKAHGVHVAFTNQTYFGWTHNKGVIADGNRVLISSINWSNESVSENREAGVIIQHTSVANYFAQVFQWDWDVGEYLGAPAGLIFLTGPETTITGLIPLTWTTTLDEGDIAMYQVQGSTSAAFSTVVINTTVTTKAYTADVTAFGAGTYYFRTRGIYTNGSVSNWSYIATVAYLALPPIPGFPFEAIAIGAIFALGLGLIARRRKQRQN